MIRNALFEIQIAPINILHFFGTFSMLSTAVPTLS